MRIGLLLLLFMFLPVAEAREAPLQVEGAVTVNALQARQLYEHGVLFVDVRAPREWSWGHVHGALHMQLDGRFADLAAANWPRNMPMVLYCDSEVCPEGAEAARRAVSWGYQQVYYFRTGYFAWQLLDFPLGKGEEGEIYAFILEAQPTAAGRSNSGLE